METKSFATFKDGHTEEILYFEKVTDKQVMFTTKSGVYVSKEGTAPTCVWGLTATMTFFKLRPSMDATFNRQLPCLVAKEVHDIESITLDERVQYEYAIDGDGVYITGEVTAAPDASDEEIKKLILEKLDIQIERKEYDE